MSRLKFERFDKDNQAHIDAVLYIEREQAQERPRMLPINLTTVAEHHLGLIAFRGAEYEVAGYNAILTEYPRGIIEIGGLFVAPHLRGQGIAKAIKGEMFRRISAEFPAHSLITFCNEDSQHLNEEFGFRPAERHEIPEEAFNFCMTECPKGKNGQYECILKAGQLCCDTILVHEPLGSNAAIPVVLAEV